MKAPLCIALIICLNLKTSSSAAELRSCRPGLFLNSTIDRCQDCPSGTYTDNHNWDTQCHPCSPCTGGRRLVSSCNASNNAVCKCPDDHYEHEDGCTPKAGTQRPEYDQLRENLQSQIEKLNILIQLVQEKSITSNKTENELSQLVTSPTYAKEHLPNESGPTWAEILNIIMLCLIVVFCGIILYLCLPEIRKRCRSHDRVNYWRTNVELVNITVQDLGKKLEALSTTMQEHLNTIQSKLSTTAQQPNPVPALAACPELPDESAGPRQHSADDALSGWARNGTPISLSLATKGPSSSENALGAGGAVAKGSQQANERGRPLGSQPDDTDVENATSKDKGPNSEILEESDINAKTPAVAECGETPPAKGSNSVDFPVKRSSAARNRTDDSESVPFL